LLPFGQALGMSDPFQNFLNKFPTVNNDIGLVNPDKNPEIQKAYTNKNKAAGKMENSIPSNASFQTNKSWMSSLRNVASNISTAFAREGERFSFKNWSGKISFNFEDMLSKLRAWTSNYDKTAAEEALRNSNNWYYD